MKIILQGITMGEAKLESDLLAAQSAPLIPLAVPTFDLNASPTHLLHRAQQMAADLHVGAFGSGGLTQRQVAVLTVLATGDGISQTDLVTKTGIDRSTLAEMVARMEAKGLMLRTKSATDSRANAVSLTEAGNLAVLDALPKLAAIDKALLGLLPGRNREALVDLLIRIALPEPNRAQTKDASETKKIKKKDKKKKKKAIKA